MVVQDLVTIMLIALLEPFAAGGDLAAPVLFALSGRRCSSRSRTSWGPAILPWLFRTVSRLGSPELFLLSVFATALLAAFLSSAVFGLSLALGAFVAGLIVSESELSHQAAGEITPFRDLFAVLFFVSVGMLLDPLAMLQDWPALLAMLVVAIGVKAGASIVLGRLLGHAAAQRDPPRRGDRPGRRVQLPPRRAGAVPRACSTSGATTSSWARPSSASS